MLAKTESPLSSKKLHDLRSPFPPTISLDRAVREIEKGGRVVKIDGFYRGGQSYGHVLQTSRLSVFSVPRPVARVLKLA